MQGHGVRQNDGGLDPNFFPKNSRESRLPDDRGLGAKG